jgi:glycosyltransferase involved in cell wall biosynthesis
MKFSVLLPTRNRLEYLKFAISSVLKQDYNNWEIIVFDNSSEEDIEGYTRSLGDARVKYFKTESFCPVTENWNNAIEKATGDYVIMLGDDDCLLDGYFSKCLSLLEQHNFPDMMYNSALNYVYPEVMPGAPQGYLMQWGYAPFLVGQTNPFILDKCEVRLIVNEILNFTVAVNFGAQHCLISKELITTMQQYGKFYQSPYPDYYATTSLLLKANRILAVPFPMVVIGVTPKSFGYYYFNNKEQKGLEFLQNASNDEVSKNMAKYIIPGTNMNISWLLSMETVRRNFCREYSLKVNYKKFRFLQVLHQCKKYACHEELCLKDMIAFFKSLFLWEQFAYFIPFLIALFIRKRPNDMKGRAWANKMAYVFSHPSHGIPKQFPGQYTNILDVFEQFKIESI